MNVIDELQSSRKIMELENKLKLYDKIIEMLLAVSEEQQKSITMLKDNQIKITEILVRKMEQDLEERKISDNLYF